MAHSNDLRALTGTGLDTPAGSVPAAHLDVLHDRPWHHGGELYVPPSFVAVDYEDGRARVCSHCTEEHWPSGYYLRDTGERACSESCLRALLEIDYREWGGEGAVPADNILLRGVL